MKGYGNAAKIAANLLADQTSLAPRDAWSLAVAQEFEKESLRNKDCPRATFLALCQAGKVKAAPSGDYTRSQKNAAYALDAVELLGADRTLSNTPKALWKAVTNGREVRHNSQMDVVTALWNNNLISR